MPPPPRGPPFPPPPKIEAADIERSVPRGAQAFRKTLVGNADRHGLCARHDVACDAEHECQSDEGVAAARGTTPEPLWGGGWVWNRVLRRIHDRDSIA